MKCKVGILITLGLEYNTIEGVFLVKDTNTLVNVMSPFSILRPKQMDDRSDLSPNNLFLLSQDAHMNSVSLKVVTSSKTS